MSWLSANAKSKSHTQYRTAFNISWPLLRSWPLGISRTTFCAINGQTLIDYLWCRPTKRNTFNDYKSSRLLIAVAKNCKSAVLQHKSTKYVVGLKDIHSAWIASHSCVDQQGMMTVLVLCKATDIEHCFSRSKNPHFFIFKCESWTIIILYMFIHRGRANMSCLIKRPILKAVR